MISVLVCIFLSVSAFADTPKPVDILSESAIPAVIDGQSHYLLVCVDQYNTDTNNLGNTDGIVMVTLDKNRNEIMFTTFMREELVQRPDGKIGRITYITKNYGIEALLNIIGTHYGVSVDQYILVDWNQVANIVDAVDGVDIKLTNAEIEWIKENRYNVGGQMPVKLDNGLYHCKGRFTMHFMRVRNVGSGYDFGRTDRIRAVLTTIAEKLKGIDYNMAVSLLSTVMENTAMTNISLFDSMNVITTLLGMNNYTVRQLQMPQQEDTARIIYAGMDTREVDFATSRQKLHTFLMGE